MNPAKFKAHLLHPKYWLSWCAMGLWWLVSQLPLPVLIFLGRQLGNLLYSQNGSRAKIARRNIERCYPNLSTKQVEACVKTNLQETSIGIFESGAAWFWPTWRFRDKYIISGLEHIQRARDNNKGVLFLGIHFTTIEIGASLVNLNFPISGFYRPHKNAVYEFVQAFGRIRRNNHSSVIPNNDTRGIIKALRAGTIINYAPDQDYGKNRSVFVPFFNIQAATVKAPTQLSRAGKAEVIPWITKRDPETNRYTIEICEPMTQLLGRGEQEDALTINKFIETRVRANPNQYLWVHRRFKTRPEDEESFY